MTARISLKTVTKTFKLIWSGIFFTQYMEMCGLLVRQLKREMIANEIICHFLRENWQRSNMYIWIYKSIYIYIIVIWVTVLFRVFTSGYVRARQKARNMRSLFNRIAIFDFWRILCFDVYGRIHNHWSKTLYTGSEDKQIMDATQFLIHSLGPYHFSTWQMCGVRATEQYA